MGNNKDLLLLDAMNDLKKVDSFANTLINDKTLQTRFFKNPSKVMIELGFHAPTTNKAIAITNRVFYATLTNRKLLKYVVENMPRPKISTMAKEKFHNSLKNGKIKMDLKVDEMALRAIWSDEKFLRTVYLQILEDINKKGILTRKFSKNEIASYVEKVLEHHKARKPISKMPKLDHFGPRYGVGYRYGVLSPEVGGIATAVLMIQVGAALTIPVIGPELNTPHDFDEGLMTAFLSSKSGLKAAAAMSKLLSFSNDLALFAQNLEKENYYGKPKGKNA